MDRYDVGDAVAITATLTNLQGSPAIPSTVVFIYRNPSGGIATVVGSKVASGVYFDSHALDVAGDWHVRVQGIGVNPFAEEFSFHVEPSRFV